MSLSILNLEALDRVDLIKRWKAAFGSPPPPSTSQDMMRLIIGWDIQAKTARPDVRDLSAAVSKLLRSDGVTGAGAKGEAPVVHKPKVDLSAGTRLSRDWQGKTYTVDVLDKGFAYDSKLYTSLSPIAKAITGSHRSGPLFFGVSK